jgi:hypothetical protein
MVKSSKISALDFGIGRLSERTSGIHGTYALIAVLIATPTYNMSFARMKLSKPAAGGLAYSSKKCPGVGGIFKKCKIPRQLNI